MQKELVEVYFKIKKDYPEEEYINRVKSAIDRDDVDGVIMTFNDGISIIIAEMERCTLNLEDYKKFITEKINKEFTNEILKIDFIFEGDEG